MGSYGMSTDSGAWLMSIFTMVGIFLSLPASGRAKRIGPKLLLLACAVIVVGGVMGAFAGSTWQMIMSRGIEGRYVFVTVAGPCRSAMAMSPSGHCQRDLVALDLPRLCHRMYSHTGGHTMGLPPGLKGTWLVYAGIVIAAAVVMAVFIRGNGDASADDEASGDAVGRPS